MIEIDGNYLEGGGQILRTAIALSLLTKQPFHITNIRKGRSTPGLKAQHLHAIKILEQLGNIKTDGACVGTEELTVYPIHLKGGTLTTDIGTAGSITLVLQALLLPLCFANTKTKLIITGGTDVAWSPSIDYFKEVILPHYQKYAKKIELTLTKRGYYPKGGGQVTITITPRIKRADYHTFHEFLTTLNTPNIAETTLHKLTHITGIAHASKTLLPRQVSERAAQAASIILKQTNTSVHIQTQYCDTLSDGAGITLWAHAYGTKEEYESQHPHIIGADALGDKEISAEELGTRAAQQLLSTINAHAPVDKHAADQLIPLLALTKESSITTESITNHTRTNIYTTQQFIPVTFTLENTTLSSKHGQL